VPSVSRTIDCGPERHKRVTMRSRVSSPSAAKTEAVSAICASCTDAVEGVTALALLPNDELLDELALDLPALGIGLERLCALLERYCVEAGLGDRQLHAAVRFLELEGHERHRLLQRVPAVLEVVRMPPERKEPHRLDALDDDDELDSGVSLLRLRDVRVHLRRHEPASQRLAGDEIPTELGSEPRAELLRVRDSVPDALEARAEPYLLLDAVGGLVPHQPPGCQQRSQSSVDAQPLGCMKRSAGRADGEAATGRRRLPTAAPCPPGRARIRSSAASRRMTDTRR